PPESEQRRGNVRRFIAHAGIPVDFGTDPLSDTLAGPILVDFDGGKQTAPGDPKTVLADVPYDVLIYKPDNKLIVHNSVRDTDNPIRFARVKDCDEWITETLTKGKDIAKPQNEGMFGPQGGGGGRRGGRDRP